MTYAVDGAGILLRFCKGMAKVDKDGRVADCFFRFAEDLDGFFEISLIFYETYANALCCVSVSGIQLKYFVIIADCFRIFMASLLFVFVSRSTHLTSI